MDDILPRAGVDSAQQRAPSLGALQEEMKKTEMKLEEALAALKYVQGMARVARNLHKSLVAFVDLKPEVATSIARTTASSNQISPVQKIRSDESSSSASTSRESSAFPLGNRERRAREGHNPATEPAQKPYEFGEHLSYALVALGLRLRLRLRP